MARIGIRRIEPTVVTAPSLVWFEATELDGFDYQDEPRRSHDRSFNRITYIWTVDDTPNAPARYGAPNIPDVWNVAHRAYGKTVAFVFTEENTTYRIRLWAIDESGHIGEAVTEVQTVSAASAYPLTVCLDPSGAFTGKPNGAKAVTSVDGMQRALKGAAGPARVLIARGQVIPNFLISGRRNGLQHVGSFGNPEAPRPILKAVNYDANMFEFEKTSRPQISLDGLDCRGDWDASTETGRQTNTPLDFTSTALMHFTIWNCRFSGFGTIEVSADPSLAWTGGFGNTEVTNWSGYGIYVQPAPEARLAFVGCDVAQHPEAVNHYKGGRNGLMNTQGPIRMPECGKAYFGSSSFLSRTGWSGANDQECLRLNSACLEGKSYCVERCTLEGGAGNFKMSGSNRRRVEKPGNYLLDKVLLLAGGGKTAFFGKPHFGGTTLRNVVMAQLDVPSADRFAYPQSLPLEPDQDDADNLAEPIAVYNCSIMNLRRAGNDDGDKARITARTPFLDYTEENNVIHAPDLARHPQDDHAPVTTDTPLTGFTPRYRGIRPNFEFETGTLERSVANTAGFRVGYPTGTDQAYWLALAKDDRQHGIRVHRRAYFAEFGGFQVTFGGNDITITNTSGAVWEAGSDWVLRLDRKSQIPPTDTTYGNPTDQELTLPVPDNVSPARRSGPPEGRHAYDDFLGNVRPGPSETGRDHKGDPRPTEGGTRGAIHV